MEESNKGNAGNMIRLKAMGPEYGQKNREKALSDFTKDIPQPYVFIRTCDRLEIYYEDHNGEPFFSAKILEHLSALCAGLLSPLPGECAVFHQVKLAYQQAYPKQKLPSHFHRLFQKAFQIAKDIRHQTNISKGAPSHGLAAFSLIRSKISDFSKSRFFLLGAGHLNQNLLKYLIKAGATNISISNRHFEKAELIARKFACRAFPIANLESELLTCDILVCATSSEQVIIPAKIFPQNKEMLIIDLSVPANVAEAIRIMPRIQYFSNESIEAAIHDTLTLRKKEKDKALALLKIKIAQIGEERSQTCSV